MDSEQNGTNGVTTTEAPEAKSGVKRGRRFTIMLTEDEYKRLRTVADESGVDLSTFIRIRLQSVHQKFDLEEEVDSLQSASVERLLNRKIGRIINAILVEMSQAAQYAASRCPSSSQTHLAFAQFKTSLTSSIRDIDSYAALMRQEDQIVDSLEAFVKKYHGVLSVSELARYLDLDEQVVRRWARDHDIRRIGSTYAFDIEAAKAAAEGLIEQDDVSPEENY